MSLRGDDWCGEAWPNVALRALVEGNRDGIAVLSDCVDTLVSRGCGCPRLLSPE